MKTKIFRWLFAFYVGMAIQRMLVIFSDDAYERITEERNDTANARARRKLYNWSQGAKLSEAETVFN